MHAPIRISFISYIISNLQTPDSVFTSFLANYSPYSKQYFNERDFTSNTLLIFIFVFSGKEESIEIVIKSKTTALETCNMLSKIASVCGLEVATEYEKYKLNTEFR